MIAKMYSRQNCAYCDKAWDLMNQKGIPFEKVDCTFEPDLTQEMVDRSGRNTFPQIFFGEEHVGGYDDLVARLNA